MIENFDNIFRQRLESHETPVPSDMFERVQQRRKKRKFGAIFYFQNCLFTILGLGLLLSIAYKCYEQKIENHSLQIAANVTNNEQEGSVEKTSNPIVFEKKKTSTKSNIFQNKNIRNYKSNVYKNENIQIADAQRPLVTIQDTLIFSEEKTIAILPTKEDTSKPRVRSDFSIEHSPILFPKTVFLDKKLYFGKRKKIKERVKSYAFYEVFGAPQIALRTLDFGKFYSGQAKEYLSLRNQSEKSFWSFDTGVKIGLQHHSGLNFSTGLKYQQINEIFKYKIADFVANTYDEEGFIKGAAVGERFVKTFNRYRFVHIPFDFGYEYRPIPKKKKNKKQEQKWFAGAHLGVDVNVFAHYKGNLFNPENHKEILILTNKKTNGAPFKNNIGLTLNADFTVYRKISNITELFLSAKYGRILKPITNEVFPTTQNYQVLGFELGIRKKLKNY